jgi:ribonuclease HI
MSETRKQVTIYTDGGCEPNPGPGGYGVVLVYGSHRKQASGGFQRTTNNRMEIMAAIKGLELLKAPCDVTLISDSEYLVRAMREGWAKRWQARGWQRSQKAKAANPDLWERLLALCATHAVTFQWVKGHAGHPENELCDQLAMAALHQPDLPPDAGYIAGAPAAPAAASSQPRASSSAAPILTDSICPKCGALMEQRTPKSKRHPGQTYYFEYYLHCPGCQRMFMVEEAKRTISRPD